MAEGGSYCTNCGTQADPAARFCVKCGTPTPNANQEPAQAQQSQESSRRGFSCPYCSTESLPLTKKSMTTMSWVLFIALLLVDFLLAPLALFTKEERRICSSCGITLGK
jgi:uncharacterized membrane protein YvbJ